MSSPNNNNTKKSPAVIQEDVPHFRRVDMRQTPSISQAAPPPMPKMAPAMPPRSSALSRAPIASSRSSVVSAVTAAQSTGPSIWEVTEPLSMPGGYFLERNHVVVPSSDSSGISARIGEYLNSQSIAVVFDNKQSVARAETVCRLKFAVRLWKSFNANETIVEIQRTCGCGFVFSQLAKSLMSVAKGDFTAAPKTDLVTARPNLPRSLPPVPAFDLKESIEEGIALACSSLETPRRDAHILAVDGLAQLTNQAECREVAAARITSDSALWQTVLTLVQYNKGSDEDDEHFAAMHRHAVTILANCLEASEDCRACQATIQALLRDMQGVCPHDAAAAAKCLRLIKQDNTSNDIEMIHDLVSSMPAPVCRHATLQQEYTKLLQL